MLRLFGRGQTRYDASDRHLTTTKPDGTSVTYQRDATDRIIARTTTGPGGTASQSERYGFTGSSDKPDLTLDGTGTLIETLTGLVGGALRTRRIGGTDIWSLPNLHGDIVATVDNTGAAVGVTATYGPYGEASINVDNSHGNLDYGWLGQHQRPTETQPGLAITIEMGARQYDPVLGRFLEVDPVEGGSANSYDYVSGDPVNSLDINGEWSCKWCRKAAKVAAVAGGVVGALACGASVVCGIAVGAAAGAASYAASHAGKRSFRWRSFAREAAIGGVLGGLGVRGAKSVAASRKFARPVRVGKINGRLHFGWSESVLIGRTTSGDQGQTSGGRDSGSRCGRSSRTP
ncbi:MAG: hypothetical protein KDA95_04930 [Acidimicrobiales bacterium]|nr:hypothetical protein [Acidimicrobiales bacterium]